MGKLEENVGWLERGVLGMLKKFEKKFGWVEIYLRGFNLMIEGFLIVGVNEVEFYSFWCLYR